MTLRSVASTLKSALASPARKACKVQLAPTEFSGSFREYAWVLRMLAVNPPRSVPGKPALAEMVWVDPLAADVARMDPSAVDLRMNPTMGVRSGEWKSLAATRTEIDSAPGKSVDLNCAKALRFELGNQRLSSDSIDGMAWNFMALPVLQGWLENHG